MIHTVNSTASNASTTVLPSGPTSARNPAASVVPHDAAARSEERIGNEEVRDRRKSEARDHLRNIDLEKHDRADHGDDQRQSPRRSAEQIDRFARDGPTDRAGTLGDRQGQRQEDRGSEGG